jgi:hypothetical protein
MKNINTFRKYGPLALILFVPFVSSAQFNGVKGYIESIGDIVRMLTVIAAGVALLGFFWGLAMFVFKAGDPKAHDEGKNIMIWGIIALFVMVSIWGIVGFLQDELGLPNTTQGGSSSQTIDNGGGCPGGLC